MNDSSVPPDVAEEQVVDALLAASRVFVALAARSLVSLDEDVTLSQFRALVVLVARGPQRAVDLAQELAVTPSTATRMCDRLVRKGLAARHTRTDDRRAAWVTLTAAGRDLVGEAMRRRRTAIAELVHELAIIRPVAFASVLNAFVEAAGEMPDAEFQRRWAVAGENDAAGLDQEKNMQG